MTLETEADLGCHNMATNGTRRGRDRIGRQETKDGKGCGFYRHKCV